MKKVLFLLSLSISSISAKTQVVIDSVIVVKKPLNQLDCSSPVPSLCELGEVKVCVSNYSSNSYLSKTYAGVNSSSVLLDSQYRALSSCYTVNVCKDSLLFIVQDTLTNQTDSILITEDSLVCNVDTIVSYKRIAISSVIIYSSDQIPGSPGGDGKIIVVPVGGHMPNYLYQLDTVLKGSLPQPPTIGNPGYDTYRTSIINDTITLLDSRWYNVICYDTSQFDTSYRAKPGEVCASCLSSDLSHFVWVPEEPTCNITVNDCDFGNRGVTANIFFEGGTPPYYITVIDNTIGDTVLDTNFIVYGGSQFFSYTGDSCHNFTASVRGSGNVYNRLYCSETFDDKDDSYLSYFVKTKSRLNPCCDAKVSFSFNMSTFCSLGHNNYYFSGPGVSHSGNIYNGDTITIDSLCPGRYYLSDGLGCINNSVDILMNDRPCDSSISIVENDNLINFDVYPNPTNNQLTVEFENTTLNSGDVIIELYDMYGKKVMDFKDYLLGNSWYKQSISLRELKPGNYMLNVRVAENYSNRIIIKQ